MKTLFLFTCCLVLLSNIANAQPFVNPDMIEISYDGVNFGDGTAFIQAIAISTGPVVGEHITHARRNVLTTWECQLGTPYITEKVSWQLDTSLIAASENKVYFRISWGISQTLLDGTVINTVSDPGVSSDVLKLVGPPGKPANKG